MNRIIGWIPEEIDAKYPPEGTPSNIVDEIKKNKEEGNEDLVSRNANRNNFSEHFPLNSQSKLILWLT